MKQRWAPLLELTHHHGTEKDENFKYHNGNDQPQGFGHIGMLCDNLEKACEDLEAAGVKFRKRPQVRKIINQTITSNNKQQQQQEQQQEQERGEPEVHVYMHICIYIYMCVDACMCMHASTTV